MFPKAKSMLEFPAVFPDVETEELKAGAADASGTGSSEDLEVMSDDLEVMPDEELPSEKSDEEQNVSAMEVE